MTRRDLLAAFAVLSIPAPSPGHPVYSFKDIIGGLSPGGERWDLTSPGHPVRPLSWWEEPSIHELTADLEKLVIEGVINPIGTIGFDSEVGLLDVRIKQAIPFSSAVDIVRLLSKHIPDHMRLDVGPEYPPPPLSKGGKPCHRLVDSRPSPSQYVCLFRYSTLEGLSSESAVEIDHHDPVAGG